MLSSIVIKLKPKETYPAEAITGSILQGFLYDILKQGDKKLASLYHNSNSLKPFTVSPLKGKFGRTSTERLIVKNFDYWLRFTFLTKDTFEAFSRVVFPLSAERASVNLGNNEFILEDAILNKSVLNTWAGLSSYEKLIEEAKKIVLNAKSERNKISILLKFSSMTTFKKGDFNYLFPQSDIVFNSYLKKWNTFFIKQFDADEVKSFVQNYLLVSSYDLKSDIYHAGTVSLQGFIGNCRYILLNSKEKLANEVLTLALFSFYAGTGQKTTMGMGMTKPIIKEVSKCKTMNCQRL